MINDILCDNKNWYVARGVNRFRTEIELRLVLDLIKRSFTKSDFLYSLKAAHMGVASSLISESLIARLCSIYLLFRSFYLLS